MKNELKNIVDNEMLLKRIEDLTKRLEEKENEKPIKVEVDYKKFRKDRVEENNDMALISLVGGIVIVFFIFLMASKTGGL